MSAVRAYLAALVFLLPIGGCLVASSMEADQMGLDHSTDYGQLPITGCGRSAESCELP